MVKQESQLTLLPAVILLWFFPSLSENHFQDQWDHFICIIFLESLCLDIKISEFFECSTELQILFGQFKAISCSCQDSFECKWQKTSSRWLKQEKLNNRYYSSSYMWATDNKFVQKIFPYFFCFFFSLYLLNTFSGILPPG